MYHLLTGEVPFTGESALEIAQKKGIGVYPPASSVVSAIPGKLDEILARMLARDPADRYQTASEVIVDLERSQLAAAIPSFVSVDSALQDPVMRQRLTSPVEATQPDLRLKQALEQAKEKEVWFLRYQDQRGNQCKTKATTAEILDRLKKGTIPPQAEASRTREGKYRPLPSLPEFEKAAVPIAKKVEKRQPKPAVESEAASRQEWWWVVAAAGVGVVGIVVALAVILLRWA